jgi:hypothetical protein
MSSTEANFENVLFVRTKIKEYHTKKSFTRVCVVELVYEQIKILVTFNIQIQ